MLNLELILPLRWEASSQKVRHSLSNRRLSEPIWTFKIAPSSRQISEFLVNYNRGTIVYEIPTCIMAVLLENRDDPTIFTAKGRGQNLRAWKNTEDRGGGGGGDSEERIRREGFVEAICKVRFLANPWRAGDGSRWRIAVCDLGRSIRKSSFSSPTPSLPFLLPCNLNPHARLRNICVRLREIRIQHVPSCAIHVQNLGPRKGWISITMSTCSKHRNC